MSNEKARVQWIADNLLSTRRTRNDSELVDYGLTVPAGVTALDDCAVVSVRKPIDLAVGADYVRGPKFRLYEAGYLTNADIGRFCVTANASDIAAMGALGLGFISIVRYPPAFSDDDFREVMWGIDEACETYGLRLMGGDTGSAERLILTGFAIGANPPDRNLLRSHARPGDVVAVTRRVGGAGAAVFASAQDVVSALEPGLWQDLLTCWTGFNAQMDVGRALAELGIRMACQDVSDGLEATAAELARASGVGIVLDMARIPVGAGVAEVAALVGKRAEELAISASTDFCLCFTCPAAELDRVVEAVAAAGSECHVVGECVAGSGVGLLGRDGNRRSALGVEWNHADGENMRKFTSNLLGKLGDTSNPNPPESS
jgi:thiamine-monophosphate kinase